MPTSTIVANEDGSYTVTITVPAPAVVAPVEPTITEVDVKESDGTTVVADPVA